MPRTLSAKSRIGIGSLMVLHGMIMLGYRMSLCEREMKRRVFAVSARILPFLPTMKLEIEISEEVATSCATLARALCATVGAVIEDRLFWCMSRPMESVCIEFLSELFNMWAFYTQE